MNTNRHEYGGRTAAAQSAGFQTRRVADLHIGGACEVVKKRPRASQSQRDCVLQPRVARNELPWVRGAGSQQPQRGCGHDVATCRNPVGVVMCFGSASQGSSCRATLGFETESRWD